MKNFLMRGSTLSLLMLIGLLSLILISFSSFGLFALAATNTPMGVFMLCGTLLVTILGFGLTIFCEELFAYLSKVIIDEESITWIRPFRKRRVFPLKQLSCWGGVSYAPRSTMIFFCAENEDNLIDYLQKHQHECQKIFGVNRCEQMKNDHTGQLQLAAGTYIRHNLSGNRNLFILRYGNIQRIKSLVNVLRRNAMITGPWLIDTASDWNQAIKFIPE